MKYIFILSIFIFSVCNLLSLTNQNGFSTGFEYNQWIPLRLKGLDIKTYGYSVGYVEFSLSNPISGNEWFPKIPKIRFETNFNTKYQKEIIELKETEADPNKYLKILGFISSKKDISNNLNLNGAKIKLEGHLTFKYENEAFMSEITNNNDLYYIDSSDEVFFSESNSKLVYSTLFSCYSIGFLKEKDYQNSEKDFMNFKGFFYSEYRKPYFITYNNTQASNILFYAVFSSIGYEYFGDYRSKNFDLESNIKLGYGKINLSEELSMEDFSIDAKSMGYFEVILSPKLKFQIKNSITFNLGCQYNFKLFAKREDSENGDTVTFKDPMFNYDQLIKYQLLFNWYF